MTPITIPAQVVNGHLQHDESLSELEGQHVLATLTVVPMGADDAQAGALPIEWRKWGDKLDAMKSLVDGWDSYQAPAPSPASIGQAGVFLGELTKADNAPARLAPSIVGGVGYTFKVADRKVYVEFRNTGSVHALFSDGVSDPDVSPIQANRDDYVALLTRIKKYLHE